MRVANNRVSVNVLSSIIQIVITSLIYFFLYRFLLKKLGAEELGIWSLVISTSSIANLANVGFTSSLVKLIAENVAKNEVKVINELIRIALICTILFFSILSLIVYFAGSKLMIYFIEHDYVDNAISLLPLSLLSLLINAVGGVYTSVLEGFQLNYIKNIIYTVSMLVFALISVLLISKFKLFAITYAQIAQALLVLGLAINYSRKLYGGEYRKNIFTWNRRVFKDLMSYSYKFQLVSIAQILFEPITKGTLSRYGGLSLVAYYEMANRLVSQIRSVLISANQVMIPIIATKVATNDDKLIKEIYLQSVSVILFIEVPLITFIILLAPTLSYFWIGSINQSFLVFFYILSTIAFIHTLNGPAYFGMLGEGNLNSMLRATLIMLFLNISLAHIFSLINSNYGAAIASASAIIVGTLMMSISYQKSHSIYLSEVLSKEDIALIIGGVIVSALSIVMSNVWLYTYNNVLIYSVIIYIIVLVPITMINKKSYLIINLIARWR